MSANRQESSFSILIVDDEPINVQIAAGILRKQHLKVSYALNGTEALDRVAEVDFDLFLVDIMMPGMDGITLCQKIKSDPKNRNVPLLFLTAISRRSTIVDAFEAGASDYITKPFFGPELVHRVFAHLRVRDLQKRLESSVNDTSLQILKSVEAEDELRRSRAQLAEANQVLANWAHRDPLTGLWNRRKAWDLMQYEANRSDRHDRSTGVLMIDLDFFKQVNDSLGHNIGDRVLRKVSELILAGVRAQDTVVRWGGEEFLILLPETCIEGTIQLGEKLRQQAEVEDWGIGKLLLTFSLGAAERVSGQSWDDAIKRADDALYLAKEQGRNVLSRGLS